MSLSALRLGVRRTMSKQVEHPNIGKRRLCRCTAISHTPPLPPPVERDEPSQVPQGVRAMSSLKEILRQQVPIKQAELKVSFFA